MCKTVTARQNQPHVVIQTPAACVLYNHVSTYTPLTENGAKATDPCRFVRGFMVRAGEPQKTVDSSFLCSDGHGRMGRQNRHSLESAQRKEASFLVTLPAKKRGDIHHTFNR